MIVEQKHPGYDITTKPWFGPIKRATAALQELQQFQYLSEGEYLEFFKSKYPDLYSGIEWITFRHFRVKNSTWRGIEMPEDGFDYRLAITYTRPEPKVRIDLFEKREEITSQTGWYPLVQGSRAYNGQGGFIKQRRTAINRRLIDHFSFDLGEITGVRNVALSQSAAGTHRVGGTAILLEGSSGNLLLDTGFSVDMNSLGRLRAIFLSHFHHDHSQGIWQILEKHGAPVILADPTLFYLYKQNPPDSPLTHTLLSKACNIDSTPDEIKVDGDLKTYRVFHAPGSYGIVYRDPAGLAVFYPGDICLKNGFLDERKKLMDYIQAYDGRKKVVLLDCAMARRQDYTIEAEDTQEEILAELTEGVRRRSVFFVSRSEEASIYTFVQTFVMTGQNEPQPWLVVNDHLYELTQQLILPVLKREFDNYDPFILQVLGKGINNFIESYRVYPLSALKDFSSNHPIIIFATKNDFIDNPILLERLRKGDMIIVGTQALDEREDDIKELAVKCRMVHRVASPDWSFHTNGEDMAEFIRELSSSNIRSILFHCQSDVLKRFIRDYELDPTLVAPISHKGVRL